RLADVVKSTLELALHWSDPAQQIAVAHSAVHAVMSVERFGTGEYESDLAIPCQCATPVGADVARIAAVKDFTQHCEHFLIRLGPQRQHRREIFQDDDSELSDLRQQSAGGLFV